MNTLSKSTIIWPICFLVLSPVSINADTATSTQQLRIITPKVAIIDINNSGVPLQMEFNPIAEAGKNFLTATVTGYYDVTSNIPGLKLYAQTDINLAKSYNLKLEVKEGQSFYQNLSTSAQKVSSQDFQTQTKQPLKYKASPVDPLKAISHGKVDVKITYTLVAP